MRIPISGEEFERRLRWISQMRDLVIGLRASALEAYREGRLPHKPATDIRSDYEYWRRLAEEKRSGRPGVNRRRGGCEEDKGRARRAQKDRSDPVGSGSTSVSRACLAQ